MARRSCNAFNEAAKERRLAANNTRRAALAAENSAVIIDMAALAETVGRARWHRAKLPFGMRLVLLYAEHVARVRASGSE